MKTNKDKALRKKVNNINSALGFVWKSTLEELKLRVDDEAMDKWFYCFSIVKMKKNLVVFRYTGNGDMNEFNDEWKEVFSDCFFTVLGYETEIKIEQVKPREDK